MHVAWTIPLTTDDGALIQQVDVIADVAFYQDAGTVTDDVMVRAVFVEHRDHPLAPPRHSPITGPLSAILIDALEADGSFQEDAHARLCATLTGPHTHHAQQQADRRAHIAESGVFFGRHPPPL